MTRTSASSILVLVGALALGACNRTDDAQSTPGGTSGTTSSSGAMSGGTPTPTPGSQPSVPGTGGPAGADSGTGSGAASAGASGGAAGSSAPSSAERDKRDPGSTGTPGTPSPGTPSPGTSPGTSSGGTSSVSGSGSGGGGGRQDTPMLLAAGPEGSLRDAERKFLVTAAQNGYAEIAASQLALEKAQDPQIKQYAQRMIDEHTAADRQLKELATSKGVNVPQADPGKYKSDLDKLRGLQGAEFDRAYADRVGVKAHKDAVSLFDKMAKDARDPDVKAFAAKMAPTLHEHLSMGESMEKSADMNARAQRSSTTRGTGTSGSAGPMQPSAPATR